MAQTKYKYNPTTLKLSYKFNFNVAELAAFKEFYNYPEQIENPVNPGQMIPNTEPLEVFFHKLCINKMDENMKIQYRASRQTGIVNTAIQNLTADAEQHINVVAEVDTLPDKPQ